MADCVDIASSSICVSVKKQLELSTSNPVEILPPARSLHITDPEVKRSRKS